MAQLAFDLPWRSADGAEDFLVAPSNEAAVGWTDRWPDWPSHALVLSGPAAAGKSHLAGLWAGRAAARRLQPETLEAAVAGLMAGRGGAFLLDPVQPVLASGGELALLHLLNAVREGGGTLLLVAETAPAQWGIGLPDLASRLLALPVTAIGAPDDALLGALLVKLFRDRGLAPAPAVIAYLVKRVERSGAALRRTVADLDAAALAGGHTVSIALARRVLGGG